MINLGFLIVAICVQSSFNLSKGIWQCITWHSLEHTLTRHSCPKSIHKIVDSPGRYLICSFRCLAGKIYQIHQQRRACKWALNVQSTFLDMPCSATARHLPHGVLILCCTDTTTSISQIEALVQTGLVEQFPENLDIIEQSACQVTGKGPMMMSPAIPAQTLMLTLKLTRYTGFRGFFFFLDFQIYLQSV
jgi:hypothetical protein